MGYRQVLGVPEFGALFAADVLSVLGDQVARLAIALLVYQRTGSAFASTATYACSFLTWFVGGPVLSVAADRYPRRGLMILCDLGRLVFVLLMCLPGLPLALFFAALAVVGLLTPPFEAARSGLIADIVTGDLYVASNGLTQAMNQAGQVGGFLFGGVLVALAGARGALVADAVTFGMSAVLIATVVRGRPPAQVVETSFVDDVRTGMTVVFGTPELRRLLAVAALAMAALIAPEGLAVAIARSSGAGPVTAGVLTAAVPAGFVLGAWLVLRVAPDRRIRLLPRLLALACLPLLLTPLTGGAVPLTALWVLAGAGGGLQVIANAAFVAAVPASLRGRAYGVASTCLMTVQGGTLLLAGALAELVGPRMPVALIAAGVLLAAPLVLGPRGRHAQVPA